MNRLGGALFVNPKYRGKIIWFKVPEEYGYLKQYAFIGQKIDEVIRFNKLKRMAEFNYPKIAHRLRETPKPSIKRRIIKKNLLRRKHRNIVYNFADHVLYEYGMSKLN